MSMDVDKEVVEQILEKEISFYIDKDNPSEVYVEYPSSSGALCFAPIKNKMFKSFFSYRYRELAEEDISPLDIFDYLEMKEEDAIYKQINPVTIHRRIAGTLTGEILYFLADSKWQCVKVTADGWEVCHSKDIKFMQYQADRSQVMPVTGGDLLNLLRPFVNLGKDDFILFVTFLVQSFSRSSSHYAAVISSNKGTGKSTLTKMIRSIVDPSTSEVPLTPTSESDLKTLLANTYLACFDNTASMSAKYSDILCAAITGTKEAKRKLYSNAEQVVLNLHNLVVINGIDIVPHRSDLADRSLLFELRPISKANRKTDAAFWRDFESKKAQIMGAIFDTLSKAMAVLPTLDIKNHERMADAYEEMIAIAVALGIEQEEYERIFQESRDRLQNAYNQNSEFVDLIIEYMKFKNKVKMPATQLYEELSAKIVGSRDFFPKSPSALSRKLNLESDALYAAGFEFERDRTREYNHLIIRRTPGNQMTKVQRDSQQKKFLLEEYDDE